MTTGTKKRSLSWCVFTQTGADSQLNRASLSHAQRIGKHALLFLFSLTLTLNRTWQVDKKLQLSLSLWGAFQTIRTGRDWSIYFSVWIYPTTGRCQAWTALSTCWGVWWNIKSYLKLIFQPNQPNMCCPLRWVWVDFHATTCCALWPDWRRAQVCDRLWNLKCIYI